MQKLATIEIIKEIRDIPDADKIQLAIILGYQSVIKKNEYKVGDKVIFVYTDTLLQPADWNSFLWDKNDPTKDIRIKNVKLRNTLSSGIIFPISVLQEYILDAGTDVSQMIGVSKYEKPIPACLAGVCKGNFPRHLVAKTDEDNALSYPEVLDELLNSSIQQELVALLKIDGCSSSFILDQDNEFRVCSRNLELKQDENNTLWKMAKKYDLAGAIKNSGKHLAIQAETFGSNIQKNPLKINDQQIAVFLIRDLDESRWFSYDEMLDFCYKYNIPTAKELNRFYLVNPQITWTIESLQKKADELTYGEGIPAEGFVLRTVNPFPSAILAKDWLSVKFINRLYKD